MNTHNVAMSSQNNGNNSLFGHVFFAAPHRMLFFLGGLQLIFTISLWTILLIGYHTFLWNAPALSVPSLWLHVFLVLYCLYPMFIFGFFLTTYPKWMQQPPIAPRFYILTFTFMATGLILIYPGLMLSRQMVLVGGLIYLIGWLIALLALLTIYKRTEKKKTPYEHILTILVAMGFICAVTFLTWLPVSKDIHLKLGIIGGFWFFLMPLIFVVAHRMIPFFSSCVLDDYQMIRPKWSLPFILTGLAAHGVIELAAMPKWLFIVDLPVACALFYLSYLWGLRRSFKQPLLTILHIAFLWMPVAMLFYSVQSIVYFATDSLLFGKAPLHALGIGFATSMVLAMATRVSLGHSGRPLKASRLALFCFGVLQLITIVRIIAELPLDIPNQQHLLILAGILWVLVFLFWAKTYLPIYMKPRIDGKPG